MVDFIYEFKWIIKLDVSKEVGSSMRRFAAEKLTAGLVADELTIAGLDFAADCDDAGAAFDSQALEAAVIDVHVVSLRGDRAAVVGVVDDKVGVAAGGDCAFAREEAEEARGLRAGGIDEAMEVDAAFGDAVGVEQVHAVFD